jgi:hypothetical protein
VRACASKLDRSRLRPAVAMPLCGDAFNTAEVGAPPVRAGLQPAEASKVALPCVAASQEASGTHRFAQEEVQAICPDLCLVCWWHRIGRAR